MRVPNVFLTAKFMQTIGLLIAGMIIGAAVFLGIYQHNFDELLIINKSLKAENQDLKSSIADLNRYKNSGSVIKSIVVSIEEAPGQLPLDDIARVELRKRLQKDLSIFKGQPVKDLPEQMRIAKYTIRKKIYPEIEDKDYSVDIEIATLAYGELHVWVSVSEFAAN